MPLAIIKLTLYNPENNEIRSEHTRAFIPWKILKRSVRLMKQLKGKDPNDLEEAVIDELSVLVADVFNNAISVHDLEEFSDVSEMISIIQTIISRANGILPNPTPPGR